MIVAGVMSGTSADGIDVALVRISPPRRKKPPAFPSYTLLAHAAYPYPKRVREAVLAAMNTEKAAVADLTRLNFLLGELYAEAVLATARRFALRPELVGCHGQTIYHQGEAQSYLGRKLAVTWQTGEGAIVAARLGIPVVSDFRPADMAAGGRGAPLVPFLDFLVYRHSMVGRVVQNIGGIANLTAIPARSTPSNVIAFDTGPGNMVIDALATRFFGQRYDRDGRIAASGTVLDTVVRRALAEPFFHQKPPKTAGREQYGRKYAEDFVRRCGRAKKQDILATATALTARSIAEAIERFVLKRGAFQELIVSGGGARNVTLMAMLANQLAPLKIRLRSSDEFGLPAEAKEAVAFAVLAFQTWHHQPANLPSATGASRSVVLGKISYA
jgi:anhydro-N-acetylmuramic acid kinase